MTRMNVICHSALAAPMRSSQHFCLAHRLTVHMNRWLSRVGGDHYDDEYHTVEFLVYVMDHVIPITVG